MTASFGISLGSSGLRMVVTNFTGEDPGPVPFRMKSISTGGRPTVSDVRQALESLPLGGRATVTVSVPATRVAELRDALPEVRVVDEGRAVLAFVANAAIGEECRIVAVVDVGESGTSVVVVDTVDRVRSDTIRSTGCGGRVLDRAVVRHLLGIGVVDEPRDAAGERDVEAFARAIRESLSTSVLARADGGEVELMTREQLDDAASDSIEACVDSFDEACRQAASTPELTVLVGGVARMPSLGHALERRTGVPVAVPDEPEAVSAKGAALIGAIDDADEWTSGGWHAETAAREPASTDEDVRRSSAGEEASLDQTGAFHSAPVGSPYDHPTTPLSRLSTAETAGVSQRASAPPHDAAQQPTRGAVPSASMRFPRIAGVVSTAIAVASGILWVTVQPHSEPVTPPPPSLVAADPSAEPVAAPGKATVRPTSQLPSATSVQPEESTPVSPVADPFDDGSERESATVTPSPLARDLRTVEQEPEPTTLSTAPGSASPETTSPITPVEIRPPDLRSPPLFGGFVLPEFP